MLVRHVGTQLREGADMQLSAQGKVRACNVHFKRGILVLCIVWVILAVKIPLNGSCR